MIEIMWEIGSGLAHGLMLLGILAVIAGIGGFLIIATKAARQYLYWERKLRGRHCFDIVELDKTRKFFETRPGMTTKFKIHLETTHGNNGREYAHLLPEVKKWLKENTSKQWGVTDVYPRMSVGGMKNPDYMPRNYCLKIWFEDENDAFAFKLTWL